MGPPNPWRLPPFFLFLPWVDGSSPSRMRESLTVIVEQVEQVVRQVQVVLVAQVVSLEEVALVDFLD
jgi:hypothetical protein